MSIWTVWYRSLWLNHDRLSLMCSYTFTWQCLLVNLVSWIFNQHLEWSAVWRSCVKSCRTLPTTCCSPKNFTWGHSMISWRPTLRLLGGAMFWFLDTYLTLGWFFFRVKLVVILTVNNLWLLLIVELLHLWCKMRYGKLDVWWDTRYVFYLSYKL